MQKLANVHVYFSSNFGADKNGHNMNSLFDVSGKVAVVTGGSGVLGSNISEGLLKAGAKVAVIGAFRPGGKSVGKT